MQGAGCRVWGVGCMMKGVVCAWGVGCMMKGVECRVQDVGFGVWS